jgi:hypothetical protein
MTSPSHGPVMALPATWHHLGFIHACLTLGVVIGGDVLSAVVSQQQQQRFISSSTSSSPVHRLSCTEYYMLQFGLS